MSAQIIGFSSVADAYLGTGDIVGDNQADDKFEEFDKTKGDVGDFEDFQEPDNVGIGEELPDFISVPVINKVQIKNPSIDDSEEESTPTTTKAKTQRAGNAARQPQRDTTSQEREL